ncbi:VOC family protein [Acidiphilium acidophilum]|uniref:VOC family protein n=1 Tax=Acidiphilium acidophilum TaxID=76588 RepID=UPI002E8E668A|nr:VOC family protein [Acidiphilium acidophilum]
MSALRIEHVNITVSDPERTSRLLESLFGWEVRWSGLAQNGGRTIHVGSGDHYVALYNGGSVAGGFGKGRPLNHIGIEVDDLEETEARVLAAGLRTFSHGNYEPGRRFYFFDLDEIEYEIVCYASETYRRSDS